MGSRAARKRHSWLSITFDHGVAAIDSSNDQVGVTVEILVLPEDPRMFGEAGGQHVRQDTGHDCGTQHVIKTLHAFGCKVGVHVIKEIVNVLHGHLEILQAHLKWQGRARVELCHIYCVSKDSHGLRRKNKAFPASLSISQSHFYCTTPCQSVRTLSVRCGR